MKVGACVMCGQQITNPLSPERLAEQMTTWLVETKPELIEALNNKSEEIIPCVQGEDTCIVTGRRMDLCTYCYTEHIFDWLVEINVSKPLLTEFLTFFHFDEGRKGYWEKAERMGIIP